MKKRFYTASEVADLLQVSLPTIRRLKARGVLVPAYIAGTRIPRYLAQDVLRVVRHRATGKPSLRVVRN